jgi:hypothetical protein
MEFKPICLEDRDLINAMFQADPPEISELTFTNLWMWRRRYEPMWAESDGMLFIIMKSSEDDRFGLPPIGKGDKTRAMKLLLNELDAFSPKPKVMRAPSRLVPVLASSGIFDCVLDRNNSDYVYLGDNLVKLPGRKYQRKRNHLNKFLKTVEHEWREFDDQVIESALDLQEDWCELRDCVEHNDLFDENIAVYEALHAWDILECKGGAILINGKVEAFTFGELLNPETLVIHVEKANPSVPGLYTAINQFYCERMWPGVKFVNREQDLGMEGLRKAKESYYPVRMIDKYLITGKKAG